MLSGNLVNIGCKRKEYPGRSMNRSSGDYSNVKLFGCDAYVFITILSRTQIKHVDLWYVNDVKGCRLWDPTTLKIIMEKDVVFDESHFIKSNIVIHGESWSTMVERRIVTNIVLIWKSTMFKHGPTSHCDKDCLNMNINHGPTLLCDKDCLNMNINHGPMSHCDKDCLNMNINHDEPCLF